MIPYVYIEDMSLGPLPVHPFGILVALGVVIGYSLAIRRARRLGVDVPQLRSLIGWVVVSGFVGAHLLDSVLYYPNAVLQHPWLLAELWNGLSSFGGFVGAALGALAWKYYAMKEVVSVGKHFRIVRPVRREKPVSLLSYADVILAVFPVAWIFGRAGCALVHDHPGVRAPAGSWLAVAYGAGPSDHFGILTFRYGNAPRYDLGLLELIFTVVLAAGFALTWKRGRASGWYIVAGCIFYAPVRFALDFLRIEAGTGGDRRYGGLTPAQWACGCLLLFGLGLAWRLRARSVRVSTAAGQPRANGAS